jgi:hypothetical protein
MTDTFNATLTKFATGSIDWTTDTIRVALLSDNTAYTPDIDNEEFVSDVLDGGTTATEFTGSGYSRQPLSNPTVTQDNTDDEAVLDADDTTFPGIDGDTVQGVLVYKQVGGDDTTPGDDPLLGYYDGGDYPKPANGSDFKVTWPAEGVYNLTN